MTITTAAHDRSEPSRLGDLAVASLAWASASAGIVLGSNPLWAATVVLAVPMAAFLAFGHLAGRGAVMACLASALGLGMAAGQGPGAAWGAVGLLAVVDLAAMVGGAAAVRMAPAATGPAVAASSIGRFLTVVVRHEAAAGSRPVEAAPRAGLGRRAAVKRTA